MVWHSTITSKIVIYLFILGNRRTLVKRAKHLLAKSDFVEAGNVSKEFTLEASKTPYVVLPCTFDSGLEAPFTLTLIPLSSPDHVTLTPAKDNLVEISLNVILPAFIILPIIINPRPHKTKLGKMDRWECGRL